MTNSLTGRPLDPGEPVWDPLLQLVGTRLTPWFMHMYAVRLSDGRIVRAYKHVATRGYLHLGEDGSVWEYTQGARFRPVDHADAVDAVFQGWEDLRPEPDLFELRELSDLLRSLDSLADGAGTAPV